MATNPLKELGRVSSAIEERSQASAFAAFGKILLESDSTIGPGGARALAEQRGLHKVVDLLQKSAVSPGTFAGSPLTEPTGPAAAWLQALASSGAFDGMLPSMVRVPANQRVGYLTLGGSAWATAEGSLKKLTALSLGSSTLTPRKIVGMLIATNELVRLGGPVGLALFDNALRAAVIKETDAAFISTITTGVTPATSLGAGVASIRQDINAALDRIDGDLSSKFFILVGTAVAKDWATAGGTDGVAFGGMTPSGGVMFGMTTIVTDALTDQVVVVDAAGIAAANGPIELSRTTQSTLEFSDTPSSPPTAATVMLSLWQSNMVGLTAERWLAFEKLRNAVAVVQSVSYSPA